MATTTKTTSTATTTEVQGGAPDTTCDDCINTTDPITLEDWSEVPPEYLFKVPSSNASDKSATTTGAGPGASGGTVMHCFDIRSLHQYYDKAGKLENPLTRAEFSEDTLNRFLKRILELGLTTEDKTETIREDALDPRGAELRAQRRRRRRRHDQGEDSDSDDDWDVAYYIHHQHHHHHGPSRTTAPRARPQRRARRARGDLPENAIMRAVALYGLDDGGGSVSSSTATRMRSSRPVHIPEYNSRTPTSTSSQPVNRPSWTRMHATPSTPTSDGRGGTTPGPGGNGGMLKGRPTMSYTGASSTTQPSRPMQMDYAQAHEQILAASRPGGSSASAAGGASSGAVGAYMDSRPPPTARAAPTWQTVRPPLQQFYEDAPLTMGSVHLQNPVSSAQASVYIPAQPPQPPRGVPQTMHPAPNQIEQQRETRPARMTTMESATDTASTDTGNLSAASPRRSTPWMLWAVLMAVGLIFFALWMFL